MVKHSAAPKVRAAFGKRLRAIRQANGYTQEEFSRALGIKRDRYAKYELGISEPPFVILGRIVKLTDKSLDFLVLGDKSNMPVHSLADDSDLDENGPRRLRKKSKGWETGQSATSPFMPARETGTDGPTCTGHSRRGNGASDGDRTHGLQIHNLAL